MNKWNFEILKVYKAGGRANAQVRFSDGERFFYKTYPVETASQLESVDLMCVDEIARIEELYKAIDKFNTDAGKPSSRLMNS